MGLWKIKQAKCADRDNYINKNPDFGQGAGTHLSNRHPEYGPVLWLDQLENFFLLFQNELSELRQKIIVIDAVYFMHKAKLVKIGILICKKKSVAQRAIAPGKIVLGAPKNYCIKIYRKLGPHYLNCTRKLFNSPYYATGKYTHDITFLLHEENFADIFKDNL